MSPWVSVTMKVSPYFKVRRGRDGVPTEAI
jgi:hypothetical protein